MGSLQLNDDQKLAVEILLEKDPADRTPDEEKTLQLLKDEKLISVEQEEQGGLKKYFSDKPGQEFGVRAGAGLGGELAVGKKAADFLSKLPGPVGKVAKVGRGLVVPGAQAVGAFFGDLVGQGATGQDLDVGEAGTSSAFSLGGNTVIGALGKIRRGLRKDPLPRHMKEADLLESPSALRGFQRISSAGKGHVDAPVASIIKHSGVEIATSVAKQAILSSGRMRRAGESVTMFYEDLITRFADKYTKTASAESIGTQIREVLKDKFMFAAGKRHKIIDPLDDYAGEAFVNLQRLGIKKTKVGFREAIEMLDEATPEAADEIIKQLKLANRKAVKKELANKVADIPDEVRGAQRAGIINDLKATLRNPEDLDAIVDSAILFTKDNAHILEMKLIEKLAEKAPHKLVSELVAHPALMEKAMNLLKTKKGLVANVRAVFLGGIDEGGGLLGASSKSVDGNRILDPDMLADQIKRFRSMHEDTEKILFPGHGLKPLLELAEEMATLTADKGSKAGTMSIFLQTPGAVMTMASIPFGVPAGVAIVGAGTILFGPKAIAGVLNNPKWAKKMVEGVNKTVHNEYKRTQFFTKLAAQMIAAGHNVSWEPLDRKGINVKFAGAGGL
tara:strand:+ start:912 stop:2762 length:1851 start_codon:yes stop_codon:yes gene_type:complete